MTKIIFFHAGSLHHSTHVLPQSQDRIEIICNKFHICRFTFIISEEEGNETGHSGAEVGNLKLKEEMSEIF